MFAIAQLDSLDDFLISKLVAIDDHFRYLLGIFHYQFAVSVTYLPDPFVATSSDASTVSLNWNLDLQLRRVFWFPPTTLLVFELHLGAMLYDQTSVPFSLSKRPLPLINPNISDQTTHLGLFL